MISKITLIIGLICFSSYAKLYIPSQFAQKEEQFKQVGGNVNIPNTVCNQLNLTPLTPNNTLAWSGYLKAFSNSSNSAFGFIFYGSQLATNINQIANYPTILWLQGGPGGSSQLGNFLEFGPYLPYNNSAGQVVWNYNPFSWNTQYNLLFIDNPIGTGISYAQTINEIPTNQDQVGTQLLYALQQLYTNNQGCFNVIPNMAKSPLFVFGESYAGKYVPTISQYIINFNKLGGFQIPLKGAGVGDGFTNPGMIMSQMALFAYNLGLNDYQERQITESLILSGLQSIRDNQWLLAQDYFDQVMNAVMSPAGLQDPYNFRQFQESYAVDLQTLLNTPSVVYQFQLNPNITFVEISTQVYQQLSKDFMKSDCVQRLEFVLSQGLPVIYYNGQNDIIVCTICTESWLDSVKYNQTNAFAGMLFTPWNLTNGTVAGYTKQAGNLQFSTVNKAGHMVPMDQPASGLYMVNNFINEVL